MRFEPLAIQGAFRVVPEPHRDERGAFARVHCTAEFAAAGLVPAFAQSSVSVNTRRGTVRGMHYSVAPDDETKLVRCTAGAIFDAIVDLRPGSPSFRTVLGIDLTAENRHALYVPAGVAHGFQTLRDDTEVLYLIDKPYVAAAARGVRPDDPAFAIAWPEPIAVISERDLAYPDWRP